MPIKTIEREIVDLKKEVALLRSLIARIVSEKTKDPEGEYKPEFVKEVLLALRDKPNYEYAGKGSLIKQLRKKK